MQLEPSRRGEHPSRATACRHDEIGTGKEHRHQHDVRGRQGDAAAKAARGQDAVDGTGGIAPLRNEKVRPPGERLEVEPGRADGPVASSGSGRRRGCPPPLSRFVRDGKFKAGGEELVLLPDSPRAR